MASWVSNFLLGVEVKHFIGGVILSQGKYIKDLLNCIGMDDCAPNATPTVLNDKSHDSNTNL